MTTATAPAHTIEEQIRERLTTPVGEYRQGPSDRWSDAVGSARSDRVPASRRLLDRLALRLLHRLRCVEHPADLRRLPDGRVHARSLTNTSTLRRSPRRTAPITLSL